MDMAVTISVTEVQSASVDMIGAMLAVVNFDNVVVITAGPPFVLINRLRTILSIRKGSGQSTIDAGVRSVQIANQASPASSVVKTVTALFATGESTEKCWQTTFHCLSQ